MPETNAYFENGEPKFPFVGNIIEAYYTDPELKTCVVTFKQGNAAVDYHLTVDEADPRFLALLEEYSYDDLDKSTLSKNERQRQWWRDAFNDYAERNGLGVEQEKGAPTDLFQEIVNIIVGDFDAEDEEQKANLFKLKLAIFETDEIKKSKSREKKSAIRKAKTPRDAITAFLKSPPRKRTKKT